METAQIVTTMSNEEYMIKERNIEINSLKNKYKKITEKLKSDP